MLTLFTWFFLAEPLLQLKSIILLLLVLNGIFLSFRISPRLKKQRGKNKLLPRSLQRQVAASFVISFILNWSLVWLTLQDQVH